jgi:hypothetical protein
VDDDEAPQRPWYMSWWPALAGVSVGGLALIVVAVLGGSAAFAVRKTARWVYEQSSRP